MSDADPIVRLNQALEGRYKIDRELGEGGMATVIAILKCLLPLSALIALAASCQDGGWIDQPYVSAGASHSCAMTTAGAAYCCERELVEIWNLSSVWVRKA